MKRLNNYIRAVCQKIKNKDLRKSTYRELKTHYLMKLEKIMKDKKLNKNEAIEVILKSAGNPKKIGAKINLANTPWFFRYPYIMLSLVSSSILFITVILMTSYIMHQRFFPKLISFLSSSESFYSLIIKDLEAIEKAPIFKPHSRERNAHIFLSKKFKNQGEGKNFLNDINAFSAKHQILKIDQNSFSKVLQDPDLMKIDTSWAQEIYSFDHWNYFEDEVIKRNIKRVSGGDSIEKISFIASYSIPELFTFLKWSAIYSLQMLEKRRPEEGAKFFRHAVNLVNSTGSNIGQNIAVIGLKFESKFLEVNQIDSKRTTVELADTYKRVSWGWISLVNEISIDSSKISALKKYMKPEFGFCSAITEYPMGLSLMSSFFSNPWPFELNLEKEIKENLTFQEAALEECGLKVLKPLLRPDKREATWSKKSGIGNSSFVAVPYVRQLLAYHLFLTAKPRYTSLYDNLVVK